MRTYLDILGFKICGVLLCGVAYFLNLLTIWTFLGILEHYLEFYPELTNIARSSKTNRHREIKKKNTYNNNFKKNRDPEI